MTVLEGLIYSWPRGFLGDFWSMMIQGYWWDGSGIVYGPIFVFERWLVDAFPDVVTIYAFAIFNYPLAAVAFVACAAACGLSRAQTIVAAAAWLASWPLTFALSVAANPEFIEMTFLSLAWLAAARGGRVLEGGFVAAAALTKLIPGIFVIPGLARAGRLRFIAGGTAVTIVVLGVVGVGQGLGPVEIVRQMLVPSVTSGDRTVEFSGMALSYMTSPEITGMHAALARFANGLGIEAPSRNADASTLNLVVQAIALSVLAAMLVASAVVTIRLQRTAPRIRSTAVSYALFFALIPHATHQSHPHTWVFVVPVWTALVYLISTDPEIGRRTRYAVGFAVVYAYLALHLAPALVDRVFGTSLSTLIGREPVWGAVALVLLLILYVRPGRTAVESVQSAVTERKTVLSTN